MPDHALTYTYADVARWFSSHELNKAKPYAHAVFDLQHKNNRISAVVQGTASSPYRIDITLHPFKDRVSLDTECTCPVGSFCKHCAAVLIAGLARQTTAPSVNPVVLTWAESVTRLARKGPKSAKPKAKPASQLHYVLLRVMPQRPLRLALLKGKVEIGAPVRADLWNNIDRALMQPPQFVQADDMEILRHLRKLAGKSTYWNDLPLADEHAATALQAILATGRAWYAEPLEARNLYLPTHWRYSALTPGAPRSAKLHWRREEGLVSAQLVAEPTASHILPTLPPWYIDVRTDSNAAQTALAGPLDCDGQEVLLQSVLTLPPLSTTDLPIVASALGSVAPEMESPLQAEDHRMRVIDATLAPVLKLGTMRTWSIRPHRGYAAGHETGLYDFATPVWRYGEVEVEPGSKQRFFSLSNGETVEVKRCEADELRHLTSLIKHGFLPLKQAHLYTNGPLPAHGMGLDSESTWARFFKDIAPALREAGWVLAIPPDFRHHVLEVDAWQAELTETPGEGSWLSLSMGILVEGERLPLSPLLHELFQRDARWLDAAALKVMPDDEAVMLHLPDARRIRVNAERIKPLAATLIDLFDGKPDANLTLSRLDAPRLDGLTDRLSDMSRWQFSGFDAVHDIAVRLKTSHGVQRITPPTHFGLQLRPYQQEGVAWLQFLREHQLGGILADDMGLGKTAQTLAHLSIEKAAGRLNKPALVVLPTSLIFNWKREAAVCAPALKILSLHGKDRKSDFTHMAAHDICLTTYPLLWRDEAELSEQAYSWLILDEAQTVKNVDSKAANVVRALKAEHRLCITGTPLENHLGELWAQFDFLLPGFLGDSKQFGKTWRTPIEKHGDSLRRDLLAARIKPFILRRKKEDVAKELPDKTFIVRSVELTGGQRDLYETVRSAMDEKVRETIAAKGFNRSQIVILDALLKLRQVCCDPRLLKAESAQRVQERAKLDLLMDMLPELVDEGRRILVFSQFTSMLALIAAELDATKLPFVQLTGDTKDRESVVKQFQEGTVPVFLISLKAGGVGLNLTAADTVIHFDPWWNPATENQATDRAHRLGQKNKVFVYKLIVAGSIEEKILALQNKKAELAAGVLSEDAKALEKFGEADLRALLSPLPD